ncbi:proton-coupled amino acid transporter 2-like isoform X2 [Anthonomus grandis grandis]|nr:proton-coupled amino acid transporter 2-like isoform X2 [Anthonomus grandis grandis]
MHLIKGYVGTGVFSMGDAIKNSGLIFGPISVLLIGMTCLHCCHLLVNSARLLNKHYSLDKVPDYADTGKLCFRLAAPSLPALAFIAKLTINVFLIMAQVGFCASYLVFISWNVRELLRAHKFALDIHTIIALVAIPVWLTCLIKTLKCLAYLSMLANAALLLSIVIVIYYAFMQPATECPVGLKIPSLSSYSIFFGQCIFSFEGIGLVLILYNEIDDRNQFSESYGVLNLGLHIVTMAYMFFGAATYMQFGDAIKETVTLNLNSSQILGQTVLALISIGITCSFALQLYVAVDILWPKILTWLGPFQYPYLVEVWFRTALVITIIVMAEAIPRLQILLAFIGSFLSVALIAIFPAIIDLVTAYGFSTVSSLLVVKDLLIIVFGVTSTIMGTTASIMLLSKEF